MPYDASEEVTEVMSEWFSANHGLRDKYLEGSDECRAVLARLGDHHAAHLDLGGALFREGALEPAERHVRRSLELDLPCPGLAYNYLALHRQGTRRSRRHDGSFHDGGAHGPAASGPDRERGGRARLVQGAGAGAQAAARVDRRVTISSSSNALSSPHCPVRCPPTFSSGSRPGPRPRMARSHPPACASIPATSRCRFSTGVYRCCERASHAADLASHGRSRETNRSSAT